MPLPDPDRIIFLEQTLLEQPHYLPALNTGDETGVWDALHFMEQRPLLADRYLHAVISKDVHGLEGTQRLLVRAVHERVELVEPILASSVFEHHPRFGQALGAAAAACLHQSHRQLPGTTELLDVLMDRFDAASRHDLCSPEHTRTLVHLLVLELSSYALTSLLSLPSDGDDTMSWARSTLSHILDRGGRLDGYHIPGDQGYPKLVMNPLQLACQHHMNQKVAPLAIVLLMDAGADHETLLKWDMINPVAREVIEGHPGVMRKQLRRVATNGSRSGRAPTGRKL